MTIEKTKGNKRKLGHQYETKAVEYLIDKGYSILRVNFFSRYGEIDIIAKEKDCIIFIEVKYRSTIHYGYPEEAIVIKKQRSIIKTATYYLYKEQYSQTTSCRFDVITIFNRKITHIQNAFDAFDF